MLLEQLLPHGVYAAERRVDDTPEPLFPEELAHIARAVPKRRDEFTTVRYCARLALRQLGMDRPPLVPGEGGAPTWPRGVVGSMTHCTGYRAAVVADGANVVSIGIDAEPDEPLPEGVEQAVMLPTERRHVAELAVAEPGPHWDRLLFSAKESVYKTWYPLAGTWLDFEDAEVRFHPDGTFAVKLLIDHPPAASQPLTQVEGRWLSADGLLLTVVVLNAHANGGAG
ncbi:4'-phosphopantetheinyl transferase family protein [Phytoactinopolyspora limicola]|uniref:4'-phosphopantetheinyl transferase family protein n=1 Tax=Phytoactinopolyspora limicola TaxID=2715536 RepID=UPI001407C9B7|nr:4'-phosphopantetheinyl transferase superfamily protein [Phytoactinopolyspora limicola]